MISSACGLLMGQARRMQFCFPVAGLDQKTCSVWVVILSFFLWVWPATAELVFSLQPADAVGLLDGPFILPCPVYKASQQEELVVRWERDSGEPLPGAVAGVQQLLNGSLFFPHLREEYLGTYSFMMRNYTSWVTGSVRVNKAGMERVSFSPESQVVTEGNSVFLQCISGDSIPPAHISWEKDGSLFTKGIQIEGQYGGGSQRKTSGTLHLANVSKDDEGEYICVTYNPLLSLRMQSDAAILTVRESFAMPEITQGPENITVAAQTDAVLHCVVRGSPLPTVHWFKNNQPLLKDSRCSLSSGGQLLVIRQVCEEDEGLYHCEGQSQGHKVWSQPAFLQIAAMDWSFVQQPTNLTARTGDSVTLVCRPPYSRPPALVSWFKNSRPLTPMSHFTQKSSGDLHFHRVQDTDRGIYFCRASNAILSRSVTSVRVYFSVLVPPTVKLWPAVVTTLLGSGVTLQCLVSGHPPPSIAWSKRGRSVQTGGKVTLGISNATLSFSSVKIYDEGIYSCEAKNAVGQAKGTASLHIAVPPVIVSFVEKIKSSLGVTVVLPCQAVGAFPISHFWSRGSSRLPIFPSPHIHIDGEGALHISAVRPSDAGEYHCTVENHAGRAQRSATVLISDEEESIDEKQVTAAEPTDKASGSQGQVPEIIFIAATDTKHAESYKSGHSEEVTARTITPHLEGGQQTVSSPEPSHKPAVRCELSLGSDGAAVTQEKTSAQVSQQEQLVGPTQVSMLDTLQALVFQNDLGGQPPWTSDLYSPSSSSYFRPHELQSTASYTYSQHIFSHTLTPDLYSQTPNLQTASSNSYSPSIFSNTPPPDNYSPPHKSHFQSPEIKTVPSYLFSPPTTSNTPASYPIFSASSSHSKSSNLQNLLTNQNPPPSILHSNANNHRIPTSFPSTHFPHPAFKSESPSNQTLPSFLQSQLLAPHTQSLDLQTLTPLLNSPHPSTHSPPFHSSTPSPAFPSQLPNHQADPVQPYSSLPAFYTQPPIHQTSPSFQLDTTPTFQSPDDQTPPYHSIPSANYPSLSFASYTLVPPSTPHTLSPSATLSWKSAAVSTIIKQQDWNPSLKPGETSATELTELLKRNTSKAPMRTSDDTARVKRQNPFSWLPTLEKHDIPIVVGVGVSLTFIFIAMAFYSLVQKNDSTPAGRAAQRNLGAPYRRSGRPETGRTYENRAFENDDLVAVVEQSPSIVGTRVPTPTPDAVTMRVDPLDESQIEQDPIPSANLDLNHCDELKMEPDEEREKCSTSCQPSIQLQCAEEWRKCQDVPLPTSTSPKLLREEGVHTSLTLQTVEPCASTLDHHNINISHSSSPLLLSHCVSVGVTTVAVDVHFYPAGPIPVRPGSRLTENPESE